MIILEGPDGSGKTMMAQKLAERYSLEYMRYPGLSSTKGPDGLDIISWWDDQISENRADAVYDRCFYISEPIYQLATPHRKLIADPQTMTHGIMRLANFSPLIIFCLPPWEVTLANVGQRDRLEGVDDHALEKIHWAYYVAYAQWSEILYHCTTYWNYVRHEEKPLFEKVSDYMKRGGGS